MTETKKSNPLVVQQWDPSMESKMTREKYEAAADEMAKKMGFDRVLYRPGPRKVDAIADFKKMWMTGNRK